VRIGDLLDDGVLSEVVSGRSAEGRVRAREDVVLLQPRNELGLRALD